MGEAIAIWTGIRGLLSFLFGFWRRSKERDEALRRLFPPLKPAGEVDPSRDLNVRELNLYYERRPFDEKALEHLKQGRSIILMGSPKMGKTRAAWQLIHDNFPDHILLAPVPQTLRFEDIDLSPLRGKEAALLFDDLERYTEKFDLSSLVSAVRGQAKDCVVVCTAAVWRQGTERCD